MRTGLLVTLSIVLGFLLAGVPGAVLRAHEGGHAPVPENGRGFLVLDRFPQDPSWYRPEAAALLEQGVFEQHGEAEWAAIVLAHELHQHLGIYTIVGAKMGVYAQEQLRAPLRSVHATLLTDGSGPMACAADGIQAALGSTFGQDLIAIEPAGTSALAARFEFEGRTLTIELRPEFQERIAGYIKQSADAHGFLSHAYFDAIEAICYTVWAEFDRTGMFRTTADTAPPNP